MGTVSKVDKNGFINLNIRIHRDDIYEIIERADIETPKISKEKFRLIAEKMHNWMSGGDDYYDWLEAAYKEVMEDPSEPGHPDNPRSTYNVGDENEHDQSRKFQDGSTPKLLHKHAKL